MAMNAFASVYGCVLAFITTSAGRPTPGGPGKAWIYGWMTLHDTDKNFGPG